MIKSQLIKKVLLDGSYVSKKDFDLAEKYTEEKEGTVLEYLFSNDVITKDLFDQAMAEYFKIKYADLNSHIPSFEQISQVPEKMLRR